MPTKPIRQFVATKALIWREGKVLLLRESSQYADGSQVGKYDLPGGRIAPGEKLADALTREVHEETGLTISHPEPFHTIEFYPDRGTETWQIVATIFNATADAGEVKLSIDHDAHLWADPRFLPPSLLPAYVPVIGKAVRLGFNQQ